MNDDTLNNDTLHDAPVPDDEPMSGPIDTPQPLGGRHPVNITHLVMGVAFAAFVMIWALFEANVVAGSDYRWLLPVPWLAAGAAGLLASVAPSRRRESAN